jgi:hypothetical protein
VGCVTWLTLRLTLVGEGCRRVKFGADRLVDLLDFDGIHVCGFALRQLTRNFFDLAVEEMKDSIPIAAILRDTCRVPLSPPGSIKRPKPSGFEGSVVRLGALQAPRKPGSPYQIVECYPGVRLYIGLPE